MSNALAIERGRTPRTPGDPVTPHGRRSSERPSAPRPRHPQVSDASMGAAFDLGYSSYEARHPGK
eukprot:728709-Pyramimonas_sp.AAC.1